MVEWVEWVSEMARMGREMSMKERAARKALSHLCRPDAKRGLPLILAKQWKCQKKKESETVKIKKQKWKSESGKWKWSWRVEVNFEVRKWDIDKWRRVGLEPSVLSWGKSKEAQIWRKNITWKDRTPIKTPTRRAKGKAIGSTFLKLHLFYFTFFCLCSKRRQRFCGSYFHFHPIARNLWWKEDRGSTKDGVKPCCNWFFLSLQKLILVL